MAITFIKGEKIVEITKPQTDITIQSLINAVRDFEDEVENLEIAKIADASGKQELGGGILVGITLEFLNGWRVRFEERTEGEGWTICSVTAGNLVSLDELGDTQFPIAPAAYVNGWFQASSSGTISELQIENIQNIIESLRPHHSRGGHHFYWDPVNGNDGFNGDSPTAARKTFNSVLSLCVDWRGDVINCIPGNSNGVTVVDYPISITKHAISLRGPGRNFRIIPLTAYTGTPAIEVESDYSELSGIVASTINSSGTDPGIHINGSGPSAMVSLKYVWADDCTGNGVEVTEVAKGYIEDCCISDSGGSGFVFGDGTSTIFMKDNCIQENGNHAIQVLSGAEKIVLIGVNKLFGSAGFGMDIQSGSIYACIGKDTDFIANQLGDINNNGTSTFDLRITADEAVAEAVWDTILSGHQDVGSVGKVLKDTHDWAELAAIKP